MSDDDAFVIDEIIHHESFTKNQSSEYARSAWTTAPLAGAPRHHTNGLTPPEMHQSSS